MDDLISRQQAIDALKEHRALFCDDTVVIDFDIKDESGNKSLERNLELSKSRQGIHLHYGEKCRVDELNNAIATIVNLPPANPWILCSERMPNIREDILFSDDVLVYDNSKCFVAWRTKNGWNSCDANFDPYKPIMMWMPLPETQSKYEKDRKTQKDSSGWDGEYYLEDY